jgi:hypothetical protein
MSNNGSPISTEARGLRRRWLALASIRYQNFDRVYSLFHSSTTLPTILTNFVYKSSSKGRAKARDQLLFTFKPYGVLEGIRDTGKQPCISWSLLKPRSAVRVAIDPDANPLSPSETQDVVTVDYLLAGVSPDIHGVPSVGLATGLWTLECSHHTIGRMFERQPSIDLDSALYQAHHNLLRTRADQLNECATSNQDLLLPCGDGVLVCEVRAGNDVSYNNEFTMHIRAVTYLRRWQLHDDQRRSILAVDGDDGHRLGDFILMPAPFRTLIHINGNVETHVWGPGAPSLLARPVGMKQ